MLIENTILFVGNIVFRGIKEEVRKVEKFYSRKTLGELSVDELINLIMYLQDKLEILEHDLKDTRRQLEDATEDNKNLYEALVQVQKIVRPF